MTMMQVALKVCVVESSICNTYSALICLGTHLANNFVISQHIMNDMM